MSEEVGKDFAEAYRKAFKYPSLWRNKWFWLGISLGSFAGAIILTIIRYLISGS
jgi:hypothetical protein